MAANIIESFFVALGFQVDTQGLEDMKKKTDSARESAIKFADIIGGALTGAFAMLGKSFLDTAAQFEKYEAILSVIEGSEAKGKAALDWVSDFAAKTPYELTEVTDAFVKLRSYGLEPTNGLLKTLGDTSAAMGKPLLMGVEAIADAVTGQNERLKEFGITSQTTGNKVAYSYIKDGQTITMTVDKTNKAVIQSTLEAIWNEKYAGSMNKLSGTWVGMWSNFQDSVTRFKQRVMESGPFLQIKKGLADLLEAINKAFDSGAVKKFSDIVGVIFGVIVEMLRDIVYVLDAVISNTIGWKTVMVAVAAVAAGIFASSIASTIKLVMTLTKAMLAFDAAAAAVVGVVLLIGAAIALIVDDYINWKEGNDSVLGDLIEKFPWLLDVVNQVENAVGKFIDFWLEQWATLEGPLSQLGQAIRGLVSSLAEALWPVVKFLFSAWATYIAAIIPILVTVIGWIADGLVWAIALVVDMTTILAKAFTSVFNGIKTGIDFVVDLFETAKQKVTGFIDMVMGAIGKVGQLLGLTDDASKVSVAVNSGGGSSAQSSGNNSLNSSGGVIGTAGSNVGNSSNVSNTTQITGTTITVNSPDPVKAGQAVKNELERMNKQAVRNGQTAVAL